MNTAHTTTRPITDPQPPEMFTRLLAHMECCASCPGTPCHVGIMLTRVWLLLEENEDRASCP